jgi:hypothetical protein
MQLTYHLSSITMHTIVPDTMKEEHWSPFNHILVQFYGYSFFIIQFVNLLVLFVMKISRDSCMYVLILTL